MKIKFLGCPSVCYSLLVLGLRSLTKRAAIHFYFYSTFWISLSCKTVNGSFCTIFKNFGCTVWSKLASSQSIRCPNKWQQFYLLTLINPEIDLTHFRIIKAMLRGISAGSLKSKFPNTWEIAVEFVYSLKMRQRFNSRAKFTVRFSSRFLSLLFAGRTFTVATASKKRNDHFHPWKFAFFEMKSPSFSVV